MLLSGPCIGSNPSRVDRLVSGNGQTKEYRESLGIGSKFAKSRARSLRWIMER